KWSGAYSKAELASVDHEEPVARAVFTSASGHVIPDPRDWKLRVQDEFVVDALINLDPEGNLSVHAFDAGIRVPRMGNAGPDAESLPGKYLAKRNCDAARKSLRVKEKAAGSEPLYLFLDPKPITSAEDDHYVIAKSNRRMDNGELREVVAS